MKIIIIILIYLFFCLTIPNINEFLIPTAGPPPAPIPTAGPPPQSTKAPIQPSQSQSQSDNGGGGLQTQVNLLSSSLATTTAIALESKKKVDDISSQIEQLKEQLKKAPTD
jgi:hypothetical protein